MANALLSEWMKVMLEEIERKRADAQRALEEEQRRQSATSADSHSQTPRTARAP